MKKKNNVRLKDISIKSFVTTLPADKIHGGDDLNDATYVQCTGSGSPCL